MISGTDPDNDTHTMRYHADYHTSGLGHVYQQRYKSFPIQDDDHFFVVCRHVERNALRAKLVDRAEDWRWGSLWRWQQKPEPDPKLLSPWPLARLHDCRDGWNGLANRSQRRNWTQFSCPLNQAVHWEMMPGWNQSPHASTSSQTYVRADAKKCDHKTMCQSKTPDPFDFSNPPPVEPLDAARLM